MGRKPDIIVATYFHRGIKLQDSSNRYSFTCKGCGTSFPKGRTSHLVDHLVGNATRCSALTAEDIADIMAIRASKTADKMQRASAKRSAAYSFLEQESPSTVQRKRQANHGIGENDSLSGLEALAEASRRVEWPSKQQGSGSSEYERDVLIDPNLKAVAGVTEVEQSSTSDLSSIAASASNLEESLPTSRDLSLPTEDLTMLESQGFVSETLSEQLSRAANFPVLIAANPMMELVQTTANTTNGKTTKSRSKFTETRREEVRDVRSKRACIRCRMLRKPCSSEDPCARCSSIRSPRIWSSKCTRGKLADVCDLYSVRIYTRAIKSMVLRLQQAHGITNRQCILQVRYGEDLNDGPTFELTALHRTSEHTEGNSAADCFVPSDLGYKECELIRNLLSRFDTKTLPKEIKYVVTWAHRLTVDTEIQLFRQASSLYHCTRFLTTLSPNINLYLKEDPDNEQPQPSDPSSHLHSLLSLAFKSMVEFVAQEDCHTLLKNMEQALVNRTLSNSAVLASAIMLFSSLEILQHHFYMRQSSSADSHITPSDTYPWPFAESPMTWATKLDEFSSFMQDLLRCRHIITDLEIDDQGLLAVASTSQDAEMRNLFTELSIDSSLLARNNAAFMPDTPDCLYFKHTASMLLSSQAKDLMATGSR